MTDVVARTRGTLTVLRHWPGQRRIPFLDPEEAVRRRDANLRATVRYAAEHVPYYRALFAEGRIHPREIRSAEDLARLPAIDRQTVQRHPERFRSTSRLGAEAVRFRTSGFTGHQLDVYHDRPSLLANIAYSERDRAVEANVVGRRLHYSAVDLAMPSGTGQKVQRLYRQTTFRPLRPVRHRVSVDLPLERVVAMINELRPDVIRGDGGYVEAFFRTVVARGIGLHVPRVVVYYGDMVTPDGRRLIEERFGAPVLSRYGAMEAFKIGFLCEERRGFHLYEDLTHVAIVRDDGSPAAPDETDEIVLSNLVNRGTVLLNYRLGDLGVWQPRGCACGRTSPLLRELDGRVADVVHLPDGTFVYSGLIRTMFKHFDSILRFQLVQHEADRFELRMETVDRSSYEAIAGEVAARLRRRLSECEVATSFHDTLEPEPGRKFRPFVVLPPPSSQ